MSDQSGKSLWKKKFGCGGCLGVILLGFVGLILISALGGRRDISPPASTPSSPDSPVESQALSAGDMAVLDSPGAEGIVIATTDDAYDEMIAAQNAKDPEARVSLLSRLLRTGRILYFPNGTPVLVVNTGIF